MTAIFKALFQPEPMFKIRKTIYENKKAYALTKNLGRGCYITIGYYFRLEEAQENKKWLENDNNI